MELDFRALLSSLPGDEEQVQEFLNRFDAEGPSSELYSEVADFLQARMDANLDVMGAPKADENNPELMKAAQEVANKTQAALEQFEAAMAGFEKQANTLVRDTASKYDDADADAIRKGISGS